MLLKDLVNITMFGGMLDIIKLNGEKVFIQKGDNESIKRIESVMNCNVESIRPLNKNTIQVYLGIVSYK